MSANDCSKTWRCVASSVLKQSGAGLGEYLLKRQLNAVLDKVRENEDKLLKFGRLEQQLLTARTLVQLLWILLRDFPDSFALDAVRLVLHDADGEWAHALGVDSIRTFSGIGLLLCDDIACCERGLDATYQPVLTAYLDASHAELFGELTKMPESIALLPLVRQGHLLGSLYLSSSDRARFSTNDGTYFLERLASFMVMCLENALYYEKLERSAWLDGLTQVNNRRYFDVRLKEAVSHALRYELPLSLMMFDLDYFKRVNDQWGHQAGDSVLQQAAQVMRMQLRGSDSFARYGGEEFVALLPDTDVESAAEIAGRILRAVAACQFYIDQPEPINMTVSIGVALIRFEQGEAEAGNHLVADADAALYLAKEQGRNGVRVSS